jgi:signal peptidase I
MSTEQSGSRFRQPLKQWIKASVWSVIYILFVAWVGNFWWLLLLPFIVDVFITKFIPWTWWKKSKNKTFVAVMGWVDAIVFALVAVYFINTYLFQNYQIPTSSLEKTLLVGDFLFVSKASYGPRVPNTPLSFPLVQHTFPIINTKSYIEKPQWEYKRLKGFDSIERYDIVVFNFPAGDTVATNRQAEDYETICYTAGLNQIKINGLEPELKKMDAYSARAMCLSIGQQVVKNNPGEYGEVITRPVDRRENYVKRCVGLPGDHLQIKDRELYINGKMQDRPAGVQHLCYIETTEQLSNKIFDKLQLSNENTANSLKGQTETGNFIYVLALTTSDQDYLRALPAVKVVREENVNTLYNFESTTYPAGYTNKWTVDNYGPIWIPKKGKSLKLTVGILPIYEKAIRTYEGNKLEVKDGKIFINDTAADSYTFKMDYYWMMGDNRHNSADSRSWGFVPEDHVVGRPVLVWLSLNKDKSLFGGKIRFNRFFKDATK